MKHRAELAVLVGGLVILAALAYGRQAAVSRGPAPSVYSTYDTGPNGYRALYEVLRRAGVPVRASERALAVLDSDVKTLVVTGYETRPVGQAARRARLRPVCERFVEDGGRLVVLDTEFAGTRRRYAGRRQRRGRSARDGAMRSRADALHRPASRACAARSTRLPVRTVARRRAAAGRRSRDGRGGLSRGKRRRDRDHRARALRQRASAQRR